MGVSIIYDRMQGVATVYCNTVGWSLGPVFTGEGDWDANDVTKAFLTWLEEDIRKLHRDIGETGVEKKKNEFVGLVGDGGTHEICEGCCGSGRRYSNMRCETCDGVGITEKAKETVDA
jgi:hypothetical protein